MSWKLLQVFRDQSDVIETVSTGFDELHESHISVGLYPTEIERTRLSHCGTCGSDELILTDSEYVGFVSKSKMKVKNFLTKYRNYHFVIFYRKYPILHSIF